MKNMHIIFTGLPAEFAVPHVPSYQLAQRNFNTYQNPAMIKPYPYNQQNYTEPYPYMAPPPQISNVPSHTVISKMEQRFAGKGQDYLQNYPFTPFPNPQMAPLTNGDVQEAPETPPPESPPVPIDVADAFLDLQKDLSRELDMLNFTDPVTHVYNPMNYAWKAHEKFVKTYCTEQKKVLFLGMNPGPYGMAQTGVSI